ncbi:acyltransferase family protein, partial [Streptomyces neyagawaensis]
AASVAAGVVLPRSALSGMVGTGPLIVVVSTTMGVAICCASARSPVLRVLGGVLGGVQALVLVAFNGTVPLWEGLVILAVMFLGTAVHRAERAQCGGLVVAVTAAVVVVCAVGGAAAYGDDDHFTRRGWIVAFLLAVLTFGVGLLSRRRRVPRLLVALGTISYSVYLVHPLLLAVVDGTIGRRGQDSLTLVLAFYAVLLPLCLLTYRLVEAPSQEWGRRLARRIQQS